MKTKLPPREVAEFEVAWWFLRVERSSAGTLSRELYAHFVRFCVEVRGVARRDVPTETMWGRVLSETYDLRPRHTAAGNRRALRPVAAADGLGAQSD